MGIADLLTPDRVLCEASVTSKKRALELLSSLLADIDPELSENDIFNGLIARERLGSTGLGHGVAIPHGRFQYISGAFGAVVKLTQAVEFDAVDGLPVDLIFTLMVPEESTDEHLQLLSSLAEMFRSETFREKLRQAETAEEIIQLFNNGSSSEVSATVSTA